MKKFFFIMFLFACSILAKGQVTIGSNEKPNIGALLDLKMNGSADVNSTKGLGLPRVKLKDIRTEADLGKTMGASDSQTLKHDEHIGLIVYNTGMNTESEETRFCPGVHVWDGKQWNPLVPYPEIKSKEGRPLSYKRGFEYLDPNDPTGWPEDKEAARASGYYQLGRIINTNNTSPNGTEDIKDQRPGESAPNTYTTSRFYVGYKTSERTYQLKKSFSCNPNEEVDWANIPFQPEIYSRSTREFDDGVWMTQNLRTTKLPSGNSIVERTASNYGDAHTHIPQYYIPGKDNTNPNIAITEDGGVLYNWSAAVAVGERGGLPEFPEESFGIDEGNDIHKDMMYKGICPDGWYLPSAQEWTDLANGIGQNVSNTTETLFANKLSGAAERVEYGINLSTVVDTGVGGYLGQAMKTTKSVAGLASGGQSKARTQGGFDAYLIGSSTVTSDHLNDGKYAYGEATYFWSSSMNPKISPEYPNRIYVYHTRLDKNSPNIFQGSHNTFQTFSVRCKKGTL